MNILEIRESSEIVSLDISQQEKIRLLFRLGFTRSEIRDMLKVKYQIVYKATNPKFAPKRWVKVLSTLLERERNNKVTDVTEVELID